MGEVPTGGEGPAVPTTSASAGERPRAGAVPTTTPSAVPKAAVTGTVPDTLTVSVVMGFGGIYGAVINQLYESGFRTWQDDVNAHGGIHGRKVVLKKVDHKETADGGVAACKTVLGNGSFTAVIPEGVDAIGSASDCLDRAGFPHLSTAPTPSSTWKQTYLLFPPAADLGPSGASFVKDVMHDGGAKLGAIFVNQQLFAAEKDAYVAAARQQGMKVVAVQAVEANQASFTAQLLRLRDAGAANVALFVSFESIGILRDARAIGYRPHFTCMLWCFDVVTAAARDLAVGVQGLRNSATLDSPAFAEFQAKAKQYGHSHGTDGEGLIDYGVGLALGRVLESAGTQPTHAALRLGIDSIRGYDSGVLPPLSWGPQQPVGTHAFFPVECCHPDYTWKGLGPAKERF